MGILSRICLVTLAILASGGTGQANVLSASLDQYDHKITTPPGFTSAGTVVATDTTDATGSYVDVVVTLNNGATFINTGGPHTPFAYNLDTPTLATFVTPAPIPGSGAKHNPVPAPVPGFIGATGPQDATPFGSFSNGISYVIETPVLNPTPTDAQNGGGHGNPGPLEFRLYGVTTSDFVDNDPNGPGYFFAADLIACTGLSTSCTTGSFAANIVHITNNVAPVPEASTWAMMIVGFLGLGYLGLRQRQRAAAAA